MHEEPGTITYFAQTNSRGKQVSFGIKRKDRERHMYIIGKTGMGKSTLLENLAIQDIRNGEGMAFIDPHGSTAERILEYVPEHRIKDVVYLAPFDMEYPIAFNVMEDVGYDKRHLVVSGLLSAFRKIWVDAWSARMEYILSNTLLALLEYEGSTLLDVNRMLINKAFRKKVVDNVSDPIVKSFWVDEFANYTDRYTQDATPAIQNKVGQFTSNPLIRNIVGQAKSSFDIRRMMDEKKILIINLSKGRVGEVNATLLGSMIVTKIYLAAMSRADVSADVMKELPSFYFYVDEFQNFANESFSDILSEARKYKLRLIIAHQYVEQMEEEVRDAVFGNVGTTVAFRVGPFDAETLETIFAPQFEATDLVNLGFAQIYLTLMIDGVGSPPFSATTLPPFDPPPQKFVDAVLAASRGTYGMPRAQVEKIIEEWQRSDPPPELTKPKNEFRPDGSRISKPAPKSTQAKPVEQRPPVVPLQPQAAVEVRVSAPVSRPTVSLAPREPEPVRAAETKVVAEKIAHQHEIATSRASTDAPVRHQPKPRVERPQEDLPPPAPPLDGAKSLREALAKVTGRKLDTPEQSSQPARTPQPKIVHAPDLRETLHNLAPKAEAEHQAPKPAELPEEVLREMLAVDEEEATFEPFERPDK